MTQLAMQAATNRGVLVGAVALGVFALYLLALDQGFFLSLFQGDIAFDMNLLHELVHDVRHVAGFPCH
jgi:Probable cobalt transporter subunit (CbtB)